MRKRWLAILVLGLAVSAGPLLAKDVPEPTGWVNDYANVISQDYRDKLFNLIKELEEKTSSEIAVVTIETIAPHDEQSYARMLFDSWKPGKKGKDNGALVLLAIKERRWRIEVGYGLEGILPDGLCGEIGRKYMVPYFRDGRYGEGLYNGTAAIAKTISDKAGASISGLGDIKSIEPETGMPIFVYVFVPAFFFLWNLPWPFFIGLPFTLLFALVLFQISSVLGSLVIISYIASMIVRYNYWSGLPPDKRKSFFGPQNYGGTFTSGDYGGGGFGGGGFGGGGFGGGGFGGGGGGGGGAGGRF